MYIPGSARRKGLIGSGQVNGWWKTMPTSVSPESWISNSIDIWHGDTASTSDKRIVKPIILNNTSFNYPLLKYCSFITIKVEMNKCWRTLDAWWWTTTRLSRVLIAKRPVESNFKTWDFFAGASLIFNSQ